MTPLSLTTKMKKDFNTCIFLNKYKCCKTYLSYLSSTFVTCTLFFIISHEIFCINSLLLNTFSRITLEVPYNSIQNMHYYFEQY